MMDRPSKELLGVRTGDLVRFVCAPGPNAMNPSATEPKIERWMEVWDLTMYPQGLTIELVYPGLDPSASLGWFNEVQQEADGRLSWHGGPDTIEVMHAPDPEFVRGLMGTKERVEFEDGKVIERNVYPASVRDRAAPREHQYRMSL